MSADPWLLSAFPAAASAAPQSRVPAPEGEAGAGTRPEQQLGHVIVDKTSEAFAVIPDARGLADMQVFCLAEEAGEMVGAWRRYTGRARRGGSRAEFVEELADVVIASWSVAAACEVDLDAAIAKKRQKIFTRGWKDPRP